MHLLLLACQHDLGVGLVDGGRLPVRGLGGVVHVVGHALRSEAPLPVGRQVRGRGTGRTRSGGHIHRRNRRL